MDEVRRTRRTHAQLAPCTVRGCTARAASKFQMGRGVGWGPGGGKERE